jgi:hypothetical protein
MREYIGINRRSALREEATDRYGKEHRITQDKESSEPDTDLELIRFGVNPMKYGRILPKFAKIGSNSTTSDRFTGFRLLPIELCRYYGNLTGSDWISFDLDRNFNRI